MGEFPELNFIISETFRLLRVEKVTPWAFLRTGKMKPVVDFYGREIFYRGVEFEGTPRHVFWNAFIEPFLEAIIIWAFDFARTFSKERGLPLLSVLKHTKNCISSEVHQTYSEMQRIDRNLRGGGYPSRVTQHDISDKHAAMDTKLTSYYESVLHQYQNQEQKDQPSLADALELKPGISGFSIDLKKVWEYVRIKTSRKCPTSG